VGWGFGPALSFVLLKLGEHLFDDWKLGNIAAGQMEYPQALRFVCRARAFHFEHILSTGAGVAQTPPFPFQRFGRPGDRVVTARSISRTNSETPCIIRVSWTTADERGQP
jgi:hypothetical protein